MVMLSKPSPNRRVFYGQLRHTNAHMALSFDTVDWIIGLTFIGGGALMVLVGLALVGRPLIGLVWAILGVGLAIGTAAGLDLLLQSFTSEMFWGDGGHKRHAMRTFLPFGLGVIVGIGGTGLLLGWLDKYDYQGVSDQRNQV